LYGIHGHPRFKNSGLKYAGFKILKASYLFNPDKNIHPALIARSGMIVGAPQAPPAHFMYIFHLMTGTETMVIMDLPFLPGTDDIFA
jgi:hypothetical protein